MRVTFGTDGIRGVANRELTPELTLLVGKCTAHYSAARENATHRICIGKDTRVSGDMLESALIAGITSIGSDVYRLGILPTPGLAYMTRQLQCDCGVMISASHNPAEDNGIKIFSHEGFKLPEEAEREIEKIIDEDGASAPAARGDDVGCAVDKSSEVNRYADYVRDMLRDVHIEGNIVVDCANGASARWAKRVFRGVADSVTFMNSDEDGRRINVECGSTYPDKVGKRVRRLGAKLGFAFDGDADRVLFVDENGELVDGDRLMLLCARNMMARGALKENTVVATVMSNMGFEKALEAESGKLLRTPVGDKYVLYEMLNNGYTLGGEQSGHIIFLNRSTTGDGLITAAQVLSVLSQTDAPVSKQTAMRRSAQFLKNVRVPAREAFYASEAIQSKIHEVEQKLNGVGRIVVRPSGTEPLIRVMVETWDAAEAERLTDEIIDTVRKELGVN